MKLSNPEHIEIYDTMWWKALWKILVKELSHQIVWLSHPEFQIIKIEDLLSGNLVNNMKGKKVVFKFSWIEDDFADFSYRWKNSSATTPKAIIEQDVKKQVLELLGYKKLSQYNSIILEEFIIAQNPFEYIVHVDWKEVLLEIWYKNSRQLVASDMDWNILHNQSVWEDPNIEIWDIKKIIDIHLQIYFQLWFNVNTEWFYEEGTFKAIQLRNIPEDYIVDHGISDKIANSSGKFDHHSRFVHWVYEIFWQVVHIDDIDNLWPNPWCVIIDNTSTTWDTLKLRERLLSWFPTVILDANRWFHLSHRQDFLPPMTDLRNNFYYMSIFWMDISSLYWKSILTMSDWKQWIIFVNNSYDYKNSCSIKYLNHKNLPSRDKVTSVLVVPFLDEDNIVVTINQRWLDIPWGHLEKIDSTFEDGAHREVMEETWVEIEDIKHIWTLESDYFWNTEDKLTYILIYSAKVKKVHEYNWNMECSGRKIMSYEDFLSSYKWKMINKELMRFLVEESKKQGKTTNNDEL